MRLEDSGLQVHSLTDVTLTCGIVVVQLSSALSSPRPTRREWSAEGLLLGCALSTHPVTLNRWKILWPQRCVRSSCGICRDIFSATRPSCGRSSHPHVLSSLCASVARLNIDSTLMARHRPPSPARDIWKDVLFALRGGVFRCRLSFSQRLAISSLSLPLFSLFCSSLFFFLFFFFTLPSLKWDAGCELAVHSYCRHVVRTQPSLILQSNFNLSTASPQNFYTQTARCLRCRSVGSLPLWNRSSWNITCMCVCVDCEVCPS